MEPNSPTRDEWYRWSELQLLFYGTALLLAGIIFFFAYNWAEMGKFLKFGLIEGAMAGAIVTAWRLGLQRPVGQMLITAAAVLVGVLLAVYGQTYQTGADPYGLFLTWALLITGWAWVARSAALWLIWLLILNLALLLFEQQVLSWSMNWLGRWLPLALALLNGVALAIFEWRTHLRGGWLRPVLIILTMLPLFIIAAVWMKDIIGHQHTRLAVTTTALAWLLATGFGYRLYRYRAPDFAALTLLVINITAMALYSVGCIISKATDFFSVMPLLLFIVITIALTGTAVSWLRKLRHKMLKEEVQP